MGSFFAGLLITAVFGQGSLGQVPSGNPTSSQYPNPPISNNLPKFDPAIVRVIQSTPSAQTIEEPSLPLIYEEPAPSGQSGLIACRVRRILTRRDR